MNNISFNKQLSNFDIIEMCHGLPLNGVYMRDTYLPS
jgi:hypothetical protein